MKTHTPDYQSLPSPYRRFFDQALTFIDEDRLIIDPLRTLAYGTDASFYRLTPKLVVRVRSSEEVARLLCLADRFGTPVTFRAAGTSLSGQALSDSVLLLLSGAWTGMRVHDQGARISVEPGVIGAHANALLARHGRKLGPDPASIGSCMIGGIAANNASGMCCGTSQNSYRTVESMKLVFADGASLDTAFPPSRAAFARTHAPLLAELAAIREEILADEELSRRIRHKYRIKNTTGYGLNAFLDFDDPLEILLRLIIGSEGTLAFIAEVTYRTVVEHAHKASALLFFPDLKAAGEATLLLSRCPVAAVELMDRASLRSVEGKPGLPPILRTLPAQAAALLVETRAADDAALAAQVTALEAALAPLRLLAPPRFTSVRTEYEKLWDVRRGLLPAAAGRRRAGTTPIIEDVAFPIESLARATVDLQELLRRHGYEDAIIFGHALDGNLHFVFPQSFDGPREVRRYGRLMDEVAQLVVKKYDGSLKAEHGTGRNMAPFVELEWGTKATSLMHRIKRAFDPKGLLNPGTILNPSPQAHLDNLKPAPATHGLVDRCMECGFCEVKCPSRDLTLTPRQRITVQREIARLSTASAASAPADETRLARLRADYAYLGDATCATDSLCATACPVSIDTGAFTKALRQSAAAPAARETARLLAAHYGKVLASVRAGLRGAALTPLPLPSAAPSASFRDTAHGFSRQAVYFPSCIARTLGPSSAPTPSEGANVSEARSLHETTLSLLRKAGFDVRYPARLEKLCCGLPFESKGFPSQGFQLLGELEAELLRASDNGRLPILCDTSPCLQRMRKHLDPRLRLHEPVEFAHDFLLPHLKLRKRDATVALHVTCSATKLGLAPKFEALARACAREVFIPADIGCCGFAGDRGFTVPELNAHALRTLKAQLPADCREGYSNSPTCELGLSSHGGIPYRSILVLLDRCALA